LQGSFRVRKGEGWYERLAKTPVFGFV